MLRRLIGEGIVLETSLAPELPSMLADPGQIEQVIMNLAVNAADAMPEGGRLMLETSVVELDATFATTYPTAKPGCYILLAVTDTGCGMSSETIAHIFEPFFTTKGPGVGTGLGLATVYGIVRQSGGYIGVYSELGIGSTFKIYLPCADGALAGKTQNHQTMRRGSETILLVEDENPVRALTRYVLQECGYTVLDAGDADEALEIAERHGDIIHLILTDVVLPGGGGRVIVEQLADARPGIKVLYMSGYTDDAVIRHGVLRAEAAFIQKPFTPVSLAAKVREVLDQ
jgi:CheY-like chemotaxis protein